MNFLLTAEAAAETAMPGGIFGSLGGTLIMVAVMFLSMWFLICSSLNEVSNVGSITLITPSLMDAYLMTSLSVGL